MGKTKFFTACITCTFVTSFLVGNDMTQKTRAIILRNVQYGDTSIIVTAYTEMFGIQAYMIKGIRSGGKQSAKLAFYRPACLLHLEVYHNSLKQINFIKETNWDIINPTTSTDVVRNLCASWCVHQVLQCIKEPEANQDIFEFLHDCFIDIEEKTIAVVANIPAWFTLRFCKYLGLQMQGSYSLDTPVLDLQEGRFMTADSKEIIWPVVGMEAEILSEWNKTNDTEKLSSYTLNRQQRHQLLAHIQQYMQLHVPGYKADGLLNILQDILD